MQEPQEGDLVWLQGRWQPTGNVKTGQFADTFYCRPIDCGPGYELVGEEGNVSPNCDYTSDGITWIKCHKKAAAPITECIATDSELLAIRRPKAKVEDKPAPRWIPVAESKVIAKIQERVAAGLKKYGVTTDRTDFTNADWLREAQEEAMDLAIYLQKLLDQIPPAPIAKTQQELDEEEFEVFWANRWAVLELASKTSVKEVCKESFMSALAYARKEKE
jgi:hypothetical protein